MKPLFILMMFVSSLFVKNTHAADIISAKALKSFNTTFSNATNAAWTTSENYYKVEFLLNEQTLTAFYNAEGKLIGVTRNISSLQLPIILQTELRKNNTNWITELFELSSESGTEYYVTLETADTKTILKSVNNNSWIVYKKMRKS